MSTLEKSVKINPGICLGDIIAIVISWSVNHSIFWAIIHGCFGWFYVIYYALGGGR